MEKTIQNIVNYINQLAKDNHFEWARYRDASDEDFIGFGSNDGYNNRTIFVNPNFFSESILSKYDKKGTALLEKFKQFLIDMFALDLSRHKGWYLDFSFSGVKINNKIYHLSTDRILLV